MSKAVPVGTDGPAPSMKETRGDVLLDRTRDCQAIVIGSQLGKSVVLPNKISPVAQAETIYTVAHCVGCKVGLSGKSGWKRTTSASAVLTVVATMGFGRTVGPAPPVATLACYTFAVKPWHRQLGHAIGLKTFHCERIGRVRNIVG